MDIGNVVLALAGKEKGQIYVIVEKDDKFVYLADGKRLLASKPKKKSYKHVRLFGSEKLTEEEVKDLNPRVNAKIRKFLSEKRSEYVERRCD